MQQQQPQPQQLPPSAPQHHEGEQKEQGPAPFPLSSNPITSTTTDSTAPSSGSCPNLELLVDTLFAQVSWLVPIVMMMAMMTQKYVHTSYIQNFRSK